jgi:PKD repeat protein
MIWRIKGKQLVTDCYLSVNDTGLPRPSGSMLSPMQNSNSSILLGRRLSRAVLASFLAIALMLVLSAPGVQAAGAGQYGQTERFGGFDLSAYEGQAPEVGHFLDPRGFAVDPQDSTGGAHDTTVYVLDSTTVSDGGASTDWRIQKFSESGVVLGSTTFTLSNNKFKATAVQSLVVDHSAGRLYALVVGQPPAGAKTEPVAQELIAWSTTPDGSKQLVGAAGLAADPLGTGAGLVSSKAQLQPGGQVVPLYQPQGIAVDPASGQGGPAPVVIEATDLAATEPGGNPAGDTVVQQITTSGAEIGDLQTSWSSASVASQLGEKSWGPGGISLNPDGTLSVMLNNVPEGLLYVVRLSADLKTASVLDSASSLPAPADFDELPFAGVDAPFGNALTGQSVSQASGAGPELVQLSTPASNTAGGLYASLFETPKGKDPQTNQQFYLHEGIEELFEEEHVVKELYFQANIGIRLLQQKQTGQIASPHGETIVNTLANSQPQAACNIGSGSSVALAAGNGGALWVLDQGPAAAVISGALELSNTETGGQVIEFQPGAGTACPQPSGTFKMQPAGGASQAGNTELAIQAGTTVKFDASTLDLQGGTPFAYEWQLNSQDPTLGEPDNFMQQPTFTAPPATAEYTYTTDGIYKVKLTVLSDYGTYTTQEGTIQVGGSLVAPTAQFSVTTPAPEVGGEVYFDASGSQANSGTITGYEWTWGDGTNENLTSRTAVHKYSKAGNYQVGLVVDSNLGLKSLAYTKNVNVEEAPNGGSPPPVTTTTGSTPPPTPPPLPDRSPTILSAHASEAKARGTVTLTLSCPSSKVFCAGTVTIESASAIAAKKHAKRRRVLLGQATFSLSGGTSKTLTLQLSSAGAKLLSQLKRISAVVIVAAHDSFGDPGTQSVSLALTPPVSAKGKKKH